MQPQVPPQGVYMNADQPSFSPNSLLPHSEVQEIDKKLSSGCYACYNCWLYVVAALAFLSLIQGIISVFTSAIFLLSILNAIIELMFAFVTQEALKTKKLEDAKGAWCLALTCSVFVFSTIAIQANAIISQLGSTAFYGIVGGLVPYYGLVYILPTYQIKALLQRRQAALRNANQYST